MTCRPRWPDLSPMGGLASASHLSREKTPFCAHFRRAPKPQWGWQGHKARTGLAVAGTQTENKATVTPPGMCHVWNQGDRHPGGGCTESWCDRVLETPMAATSDTGFARLEPSMRVGGQAAPPRAGCVFWVPLHEPTSRPGMLVCEQRGVLRPRGPGARCALTSTVPSPKTWV